MVAEAAAEASEPWFYELKIYSLKLLGTLLCYTQSVSDNLRMEILEI